jgi:hypothetical protein
MSRGKRTPGGAGRTKRLRKKRQKWLESEGIVSGMVLFHGSSAAHLASVRAHGLLPRGAKPSQWEDEPSRPDMIYLTDSYPHFFGTKGGGHTTIAYEIDMASLNPRLLFPDEDYLAQKGLVHESPDESVMAAARRRIDEFPDHWQKSLRELGTCCYRGKIPATAIRRCCQFERPMNGNIALKWVAHEIGLQEHANMGELYRKLTLWMFADFDKLPQEWQPAPDDDPAARNGISVFNLR